MNLTDREFTSDNRSLRRKAVRWRCPQEGTPRDSSPVCSPTLRFAMRAYNAARLWPRNYSSAIFGPNRHLGIRSRRNAAQFELRTAETVTPSSMSYRAFARAYNSCTLSVFFYSEVRMILSPVHYIPPLHKKIGYGSEDQVVVSFDLEAMSTIGQLRILWALSF